MGRARKVDPYKTLKVPRKAGKAEVKKAFARAVKDKGHPDTGGTQERFALILLARDVLLDDERRAHFDATGEVREEEASADESGQLVRSLRACLDAVLAECMGQGLDPATEDLAGRMCRLMRELQQELASRRKAQENELARLGRLRRRFTRKIGPNLLDDILAAQETDATRLLEGIDQEAGRLGRVLAHLEEYTFRRDEKAAGKDTLKDARSERWAKIISPPRWPSWQS